MTRLESTKNARAECGALVWSPWSADAKSVNSSNPKVHRIDSDPGQWWWWDHYMRLVRQYARG
jgi:hypothetical protein